MALYEDIRRDLGISIKQKTSIVTGSLRVIIGEIQRGPTKSPSDAQVFKTLKRLQNSQNELPEDRRDENLIKLLDSYLPKQMTKEEIRQWITDNIDMSKLTNKKLAVKEIISKIGNVVDGNIIRTILEEKSE